MIYSQAKAGRVFVIRLEDGEIIHKEIEELALKENIQRGFLVLVGGADNGGKLVVGPEDGRSAPIVPMEHQLQGVHEALGTGTLFPDSQGQPTLHMHIACGRDGQSVAGCIRLRVKAWHVLEIILYELIDNSSVRRPDPETGFSLLRPE